MKALLHLSRNADTIGLSMTNGDFEIAASSQSQMEMFESLEQQLAALYQEKQEALKSFSSMAAMQETIDNLEAQVVEMCREKETDGNVQSLLPQKDETIANLEAQLVSLYKERDTLAHAA